MTDRTFDKKVAELVALQAQMDAISKRMEDIKTDIMVEMESREVDVITTKKFRADWKTIVSNRFDSSAFKKAFADLYTQFCKHNEYKRFTFKSVA